MYELKDLISGYMDSVDDWKKRLLRDWPVIVGALNTRMRVEKIVNDLLVIGVYDQHWMHELFHMSRMIVNTINTKLGKPYVKQVRFVLVARMTRKEIKRTDHMAEEKRQERSLTAQEQHVLTQVKDLELRELLKALVR